ncbi:MAG: hypothetical protein ACM30E_04980, partial [Nitrososphaerales archaeon]
MNATSRMYEDEDDLIQMQRLLMKGRGQTNDWHYPHVGLLTWNFFLVLCHQKPQDDIRLWQDEQGELAGFAILGEDPSIDWQVLPEFEWTGIEEDALAWAEGQVAELRRNDPERWGDRLVSVSPEDDARRIALLEKHGFTYRGKFAEVNMLRTLDGPLPDVPLPPGFQVRALAEHGEEQARAAAERKVWLPYTVGNISGDDYAALMRLPGYERELDIVALGPEGVIASYANCWLDPANRIGDFGPVGALPAYRRRGLTRAVLLEGLRRMQAAGMDRVCVST